MKQVLLLTLILCLVYSPLKSQTKWSWGIQTEIGISGVKYDKNESFLRSNTETIETDFKRQTPSIGGGLWIQYRLKNQISLRSGLQYVNAGDYSGSSRHSRMLTTNQEVSYYSTTNSFRVHRLQLPFMVAYQMGKGRIQPTIAAGAVWSQDIVKNITEEIINTSAEQHSIQKPTGFPAHVRMGNIQPMFTFGAKITDQLTIEFKHLFGQKTRKIRWIVNPEIDPDTIRIEYVFCDDCYPNSYSYSKAIKTHYHQSSSLVFRYIL